MTRSSRAARPPALSPVIRELPEEESFAMLADHHVGRIAFSFHDRVDIEPIHYVLEDRWLYGRTSLGTKLATLVHHPWCAFEIDAVDGLFDWTSVVCKGRIELLTCDLATLELRAHALALIRTLNAEAFGEDDPVPERDVLFRISIDEITGRSSVSR